MRRLPGFRMTDWRGRVAQMSRVGATPRRPGLPWARIFVGPGVLTVAFLAACEPGDAPPSRPGAGEVGPVPGEALVGPETGAPVAEGLPSESSLRPAGTEDWPGASDSIPGTAWTRQDWEIFRQVLRKADELSLDTLPLGEALGQMGALFLGTPYVPRTLEVPGPERLVVNFRGLDCVTFVENVLALTRFQRVHGTGLLDKPDIARSRYDADLMSLRYRDGRIEGYSSRLHYFSEWLSRGEEAGRLYLTSSDLGGIQDHEQLGFMTSHAEAYDQLRDPETVRAIRGVEESLSASGPRVFIPQERLAEAAPGIRTGDIIAATSTLEGLDVAHTGIAYWTDGQLHLLHAPLVGSTVVLSERTLAERIRRIESQDGIMVARPLDDWFRGGG